MKTGIALTKIAASIKMSSKNARAKMRRLKVPAALLVSKDNWIFNTKGATWAKTQLKRDLRKKAA
jgi:hypothetical protein